MNLYLRCEADCDTGPAPSDGLALLSPTEDEAQALAL
jgi:hypothetical protein